MAFESEDKMEKSVLAILLLCLPGSNSNFQMSSFLHHMHHHVATVWIILLLEFHLGPFIYFFLGGTHAQNLFHSNHFMTC